MSRGLGLFTPLRTGKAWWPILVAVILVAVIVAVVLGSLQPTAEDQAGAAETVTTNVAGGAGSGAGGTDAAELVVTLLEVVDGDTIRVRMADGVEEKVRYIGIDAPEFPHDGSPGERLAGEATAHNRDLLASGALRLETDVELRDDFARLLAYVWAGDVFVNERMVLDGYAWAHNYPPNLAHQDQLWEAHDQARQAGVGVWQ